MDEESMIDALRPFALALKTARGSLGEFPDTASVTAVACRYITHHDLKVALSIYERSQPDNT